MKHILILSACSLMFLSNLSAQGTDNTRYNNTNGSTNSNYNNSQQQNSNTGTTQSFRTIQSDLNEATAKEANLSNSQHQKTQSIAAVEAEINQQNPSTTKPASSVHLKEAASDAKTATPSQVVESSKGTAFVSDQDLTKAIYKAVRDDRMFTGDSKIKIQVTVFNGKVTLSGEVATEAEKARAELLAVQANKLHPVTNNIKVVR